MLAQALPRPTRVWMKRATSSLWFPMQLCPFASEWPPGITAPQNNRARKTLKGSTLMANPRKPGTWPRSCCFGFSLPTTNRPHSHLSVVTWGLRPTNTEWNDTRAMGEMGNGSPSLPISGQGSGMDLSGSFPYTEAMTSLKLVSSIFGDLPSLPSTLPEHGRGSNTCLMMAICGRKAELP